ncbi:MAG: TonB-dependent receptor [Candidatus Glassbacteria bacterium]|nr:TonB-dependent receptor [Candidatus Glassbacteria bacterium]
MKVLFCKRLIIPMSLFFVSFPALWAGPLERELTEEVFFQPIETVITAGRTEQSIERAPATVAVISSEEIKASGALTIPDLLRLVPGLDVMTIGSSHFEVNARGLNQVLSNKLLVLIDGRSAYFDFFGGVIWQAFQIVMDQIDRIEVVRSPSSALYGANAFSGVINIITKTPRQLHGGRLSVVGGENSTLHTSYVQGDRKGDTGYRVAIGTRQMNSFKDPDKDTDENILGNFYLEHRFKNDAKLSVEGGLIHGFIVQNVRLEDVKVDATTSYAKMNLDHGPFKLQAFWNRGDETSGAFFPPGPDVDILYNTFDLEAQHMVNLGLKHTFIYGASYRFNTIESNIIDRDHKQNLIAGYFQDEYRPIPEVSFLAGARIDYHPLVGTNFSPRGSVIYAPVGSHTFRVSVGRAFRNPSFTDSYMQFTIPPPPGMPIGVNLVGEPDLESEKITTYEFGYTYFPRHYFRAEVDVFAYEFNDYIGSGALNMVDRVPVQSFVNLGRATAYGFELTADILPAPWLKLSSNYSYQDLDNNYTVLRMQAPPSHKANFKLFLSLPAGFSSSFSASYVGEATWEVPTVTGDYTLVETKAHTRCDARLGYLWEKCHLELSVAAYNLLNSRNLEYPLAEKINRRLTGGASLSF